MTDSTRALDFRPNTEAPTPHYKCLGAHSGYLVLNPCDGFHILWAYFAEQEDGTYEFDGFREFASSEYIGPDFYCAWAELPDSLPLSAIFDDRCRQLAAEADKRPAAKEG
jgi:hypothetical protein